MQKIAILFDAAPVILRLVDQTGRVRAVLETQEVIGWDRGRPARKRAKGAQSFRRASNSFSRLALICGRDA